ncbi:MAG: Spore germination protein B3 [Oscillospiraceae bacterium]|jgi:spore germination protein KC
MSKRIKIAVALLEVLLIPMVCAGCWSYHEVETYSIVAGMAIDKGQNGYKYHLTLECVKIAAGDESEAKPLVLEADGNSIFEATRSTLRESDKKLYFNHCEIVIISSDIAKEGLKLVMDFLKRDAELRITMDVLISKEKTAGEILRVTPQSGNILSYQINNTLGEQASYNGSLPGVQIYEITNTLNAEGLSLVLPAIEKKEVEGEETVQISGGAVFRSDKQVGWLSSSQAKYYAFLKNTIKGGLLLTGPTPSSTQVCLEIQKSNTEIEPIISGDSVTMQVTVDMKAAFGEQISETDYLSEVGIEEVQKNAERTIEYGINDVVQYVQQQYDSDIFGFGNTIYQNMPDQWDRLKPKWNEIFKTVHVKVIAHVKIENTGLDLPKVR